MYVNRNTLETSTWSNLDKIIYKKMSIPKDGTIEILDHSYVFGSTIPTYEPLTHKLAELDASLIDGKYYKAYEVVALTQEEIDANYTSSIPTSITKLQAMRSLKEITKWKDFKALLKTDEDAEDEFNMSPTLTRDSSFIALLAPALGLNEIDVDNLFIAGRDL
ncbi:MAG: hypothetical protein GQ570_11725 [Helicobacteraceae bacterium]|nr:hypothetical protein [Helicobacteraceae bacterium]